MTHASMCSRIKSKCEGSTSYILVSLGGLFVDLHGLRGRGKHDDETSTSQTKRQQQVNKKCVCRPKKKKRQHSKTKKKGPEFYQGTQTKDKKEHDLKNTMQCSKRQGRDEIWKDKNISMQPSRVNRTRSVISREWGMNLCLFRPAEEKILTNRECFIWNQKTSFHFEPIRYHSIHVSGSPLPSASAQPRPPPQE